MSQKATIEAGKTATRVVTVVNKLGIHARPAAVIARMAGSYKHCEVFIEKEGERINGKSIMGILMLAAGPGTKLTLHAEGLEAQQAVTEIEKYFKHKFDED